MSDDDSGGWLSDAIEQGADAVATFRTALGIEREAFTCPDCGVPCEPTHTYNPRSAAFDGGACPAWECPDCEQEFVREPSDDAHTMDLYGRG